MESSFIPPEIMSEILLRTSSDALARCKVASKEWNQTTYDSQFKIKRSRETNTFDGFLVHDTVTFTCAYSFAALNEERIPLDFIPGHVPRILAVSAKDGIMLCTSQSFRQLRVPFFFVCKPRIKLLQQIPNPRTRFVPKGMAIFVDRSNPFRYKIVRISSPETLVKDCQQLILEIFDSEAWKWKRLKNTMLPIGVSFLSEMHGVQANGAFHWLLSHHMIFSLDVVNEEWKITDFPDFEENYRSVQSAEYEGKLALMCVDQEFSMDTWVLESYVNSEWQKKLVVNMTKPACAHLMYFPVGFYGSDIMVAKGLNSVVYYNFKNGTIAKEIKLKYHIGFPLIFPFTSDSEPCCLEPAPEIDYQCATREAKKCKRELWI